MAREKLKVLDLFSGIGGFSLGLERAGMQTVAFCEIDPFCQKVLKKHWPDVPIFEDVKTLKGSDVGPVDIVCGGYPCQPFSSAGKREGSDDNRHLWPEMYRIVKDIRPRWVFAENVAGHISMGLDDVLLDLENAGYSWWTFIVPACAVGHHQRRDRVWILADAVSRNGEMGRNISGGRWEQEQVPRDVAGLKEGEPGMVAVVDGIPPWMDELRGYGNAVVPQIPEMIGRAIIEVEEMYSYGA